MAEKWEIGEELVKDIRAVTIHVAREVLAEEQARGFTKDPRVVVDSRRYDAPVETVKPFGRVEFIEKADIGEIVMFIWRQLVQRSPYRKGGYSDSHAILVNGKEAAPDNVLAGPGDKVQIVNIQPYARKIERGLSLQAPTGVYRVVFRIAQRRYGKIAFIKYTMVPLNLGVTIASKKGAVAQVYPCIQITPSAGTLQ